MSTPDLGGPSWPRDWWLRYRILLVALFVCRGVLLLCVLPPLEGCDEYQHVAYVVHILETGRDPVLNQSFVPESLLRAMTGLPVPDATADRVAEGGGQGVVGYAAFWSGKPAAAYQPPKQPVPLYEAQHGPLYYRLAAPLFAAAGGCAHLSLSIAVLRLMNVGFLAGAVWLALGAFGRIIPDLRHAALLGLLLALHPFFLKSSARVSNDALGVLLGTAVVVCCLSTQSRRPWLGGALMGLLLGLSVLAKAVNMGLLPLAALWGPALALRGKIRWSQGLGASAAVGALVLVVVGPYFAFNLQHFGVLTPMQEAVLNRQAGHGLPLARASGW